MLKNNPMNKHRMELFKKYAPWKINSDGENLTPSIGQMAKTATESIFTWVNQGIPIASEEALNKRQLICQNCEFWDVGSFKGTGRCMKCGCSTWAKIRMATEKCPIGKW
jgi:hypothetical protein